MLLLGLGGFLLIIAQFLLTGIALLSICCLFLLSQLARRLKSHLPKANLTTAICTLDLECYSILRCFYARLFSGNPPKDSHETPILFLHGMLGNAQNGRFLQQQLKPFGTVYTIDMGTDNQVAYHVSYEQEIERCALLALEKIEQIFKETGQDQIILIGHSRGGVIANYLATTLLGQHIPLVITLGTPLQHPGKSDQVSNFINCLNERLADNTTTEFLHLWGEGDLVTNKASSFPKEAHQRKRVKIPHAGHLSLLFSEEALEKIIAAVSYAKCA